MDFAEPTVMGSSAFVSDRMRAAFGASAQAPERTVFLYCLSRPPPAPQAWRSLHRLPPSRLLGVLTSLHGAVARRLRPCMAKQISSGRPQDEHRTVVNSGGQLWRSCLAAGGHFLRSTLWRCRPNGFDTPSLVEAPEATPQTEFDGVGQICSHFEEMWVGLSKYVLVSTAAERIRPKFAGFDSTWIEFGQLWSHFISTASGLVARNPG